MINYLKKFLKEGGWMLLLVAGLYFSGWHTEVLSLLQRGLLYTGLFNPSADEREVSQPIDLESLLLYDEKGAPLPGRQLQGDLVLLNVWATWCAPCVAEMPGLNSLYQQLGSKEVHFLMVTVDKEFEKAIAFRDKKGYSFPIYRLGQLPDQLRSNTIPATYVIDSKGQLRFKHQGMAQYDTPAFRDMLLLWQQEKRPVSHL